MLNDEPETFRRSAPATASSEALLTACNPGQIGILERGRAHSAAILEEDRCRFLPLRRMGPGRGVAAYVHAGDLQCIFNCEGGVLLALG